MCNIKVTLNKRRVCTGGRRVNNTLGNAHSERVQRGYRVGLIRERHDTHERSCVTRRAVGLWASSQIWTRNPVVESSVVCKKISLPLYWLPNRILCMRVYTCVPCRHSFSMNHRVGLRHTPEWLDSCCGYWTLDKPYLLDRLDVQQ